MKWKAGSQGSVWRAAVIALSLCVGVACGGEAGPDEVQTGDGSGSEGGSGSSGGSSGEGGSSGGDTGGGGSGGGSDGGGSDGGGSDGGGSDGGGSDGGGSDGGGSDGGGSDGGGSDGGGMVGDGTCDPGETAAAAPDDCPASDGDGLCTHSETAQTTPNDCPAVTGDGFCTHDETYAETSDCPPPSFVYSGGGLDALEAVSPDLVFEALTLNASLEFEALERSVVIDATNITVNAAINHDKGPCGTQDGPDLTLNAVETITLNAAIYLYGEQGTATASGAMCNDCTGADGGNVSLNADAIYAYDLIRTYGGNGLTDSFSVSGTLFRCGCDGGDGGNISLEARETLVLDYEGSGGQLDATAGGGGPSNSNCSDGADGVAGSTSFSSGTPIQLTEAEPNARKSTCQRFNFTPMVISGAVSGADDDGARTAGDSYYVVYDGSTYNDFVEDLYYFSSDSAGLQRFRFTMTITSPMANNLDLVAFANDQVFAADTSTGTTHVIELFDIAQGEDVYIGVNRKEGGLIFLQNDAYTLTVERY